MNRMTLYVLKQLSVGMIFVTAGLTCVLWLTQSLRFVELIISQGLTVGAFLRMTMLLLPNFLTMILPIALFAVVVFVYSRLTSDRELVVMRASGQSPLALAMPAIILALIVMMFSYALNLHFLPVSYKSFRELQWSIRNDFSHVLLREGAFNVISPQITVYVRQRTRSGELEGILIQDERSVGQPSTLMAQRGALIDTKEGARVVLYNGNRQVVDGQSNTLSLLYFDRYTFDMETARPSTAVRYREPRERTVDELFNPQSDPTISPPNYGKFIAEGHRRLLSPLYGVAFAFIALAALIGGRFTRRSQPVRVTMASLVVVMMQGGFVGFNNLSATAPGTTMLFYLTVLLPMVGAAYVALRGGRWKKPPLAPPSPAGG